MPADHSPRKILFHKAVVEDPRLNQATRHYEYHRGSDPSIGLLSSPSEESDHYSEGDITELIVQHASSEVQSSNRTPLPPSTTPAASPGKRKATESPISVTPNQPQPRNSRYTFPAPTEDFNPFLDTPMVAPEARSENLGTPVIIAHDTHLKTCFDHRKLPYGVQYEIARLITLDRLRYQQICVDDLDQLAKEGSNAKAAPKTAPLLSARITSSENFARENSEEVAEEEDPKIVAAFTKEISAKSPWAELDTEEEMLLQNPYAGLGFNDERPGWYGGKVVFRGKLEERKTRAADYKVVLERAELAASYSLARRFGSKHFLRLKIPKKIKGGQLEPFLKRPFILFGCVFRAFYAKDNNVCLVKTNEVFDGSISSSKTLPGTKSFLEFLEWYNPLELNRKQLMTKWATRFQLGLSNSAPGFRLDPADILDEHDIKSQYDSDMTDGAGYVNTSGLGIVRDTYDLDVRPTAVQCRANGCKGVFLQHPDDADGAPRIWVRPSQKKIRYPAAESLDPAFLVVDVLRSSHTKTPARLSVETIINLAENGVPSDAFTRLIQEGIEALVSPLVQWTGPDAMRDLWIAVARMGGVMSARRAREEPGLARLRGYLDRGAEESDEDDEDPFGQFDGAFQQRSTAWWSDQISGCPSVLEEIVMYLLDAGFTPDNCAVLRNKLELVIRNRIKNYISAYRIDVPMSCMALLVPDVRGELRPEEIFFKSSKRNLIGSDGSETDVVLGDVLITRHPCKLPTDVQKWKAVDRPELHHYTDVIIFSTQGPRRAADFLSGGDYDGDKGLLIWQPELVRPFMNAPRDFSEEPRDMGSCFSVEKQSVHDFLKRTASAMQISKIHDVQEYLLRDAIGDNLVGIYSNLHMTAIYTLGYRHPETIRLAYMFSKVMDSSKNGLTVQPETRQKDRRLYDRRAPKWKETREEEEKHWGSGSNQLNVTRPLELGTFIMDVLHQFLRNENDRKLQDVDRIFLTSWRHEVDEHLAAPWRSAKALAERWEKEEGSDRRSLDLNKIVKHVEHMYTEHRSILGVQPPAKTSPKKSKSPFTELPIEVRQDKLRALSKEFAKKPLPSDLLMDEAEIDRVKASYAYVYDSDPEEKKNKKKHIKGWSSFPWDVAMRDLCAIKARALGPSKTVTGEFYERFIVKRSSQQA